MFRQICEITKGEVNVRFRTDYIARNFVIYGDHVQLRYYN